MPPMDDIKDENPASLTQKPDRAREADTNTDPNAKPRREIGPESEVRGGPEAPED